MGSFTQDPLLGLALSLSVVIYGVECVRSWSLGELLDGRVGRGSKAARIVINLLAGSNKVN